MSAKQVGDFLRSRTDEPRRPESTLPPGLVQKISDQPCGLRPSTMLDWALIWAQNDVYVFPCEKFLGIPLVLDWYREASRSRADIINWWTKSPTADIGAIPDKSGYFVIAILEEEGGDASFATLECTHGELEPAFRTKGKYGDRYLWFRSDDQVITSHHKLGRGIHVLGAGHYVYMPSSIAPPPSRLWR
jgi:hypothetical protein